VKKKKTLLAKLPQRKFAALRSRLQCLLRGIATTRTAPASIHSLHLKLSTHRSIPAPRLLSTPRVFFNPAVTSIFKPHRWVHLRKVVSVLWFTFLLVGCAGLSNQRVGKVTFSNPPKVGSWLQSQRELVACETVNAARYMADFGFFHPQCRQLVDIGSQDYLVKSRNIVQLQEGPMWLLIVGYQEREYFVPIPWHDWL